MAITKTIGKNTIGDNDKMQVRLHDYEMSSHDISTIFRSSMASGVLTPCLKLIAQKGDIFDIQMINKTLTRPTLGPLFGAYKLQHFIFSVPFRLYNSWLHNNRTGIGLKMSDIKLPVIKFTAANEGSKFNQSSLLAYLGVRGYRKSGNTSKTLCQGIPYLGYLDIFKNYFANTQEDNFYMITGQTLPPTRLQLINSGVAVRGIDIPTKTEQTINIIATDTSKLRMYATSGTMSEPKSWSTVWANVLISTNQNGSIVNTTALNLTSDANKGTITLDKIKNGTALLTIEYKKNRLRK